MASKERIVIDDKFRPPVASIGGLSPVRSPSKGQRRIAQLGAERSERGRSEEGRLVEDSRWDQRHHVSPSLFNKQYHSFYKVRMREK